jgi:AraC-like DNA-binding protein
MARDCRARWGVGLLAVDCEGRVVFGAPRRMSADARTASRDLWRRLVAESWQWGEPALSLTADGLLACCVPLMCNDLLLGGLVADGLPDTACATAAPGSPPNAADMLLAWVTDHNLTNRAHLIRQREASGRERERAEAIHELKTGGYDSIREAYLREEPALLAAVKRGDRSAAREILNRLLVGIYHLAGNRLELLKSLTLELVVMMYRAAVESGARPTELLGMNYDGVRRLAAIADEADLCHWLIDTLERLMDGIREYRDHPNTVLLQQALRFMEENLARDITRDEAARIACLSPSHFSHLLTQKTGRSFRDTLLDYRMNRAAEILRRTSLSIAEVARQCGFPDASHFGKTFLRRMGATPLAYRRQGQDV